MLQRLHQMLEDNNNLNIEIESEELNNQPPIKLRSSGYKREKDGSVTLSVTLDKDQVECCVCFSSMTGLIYRCRAQGNICHNVCSVCEWQIRRIKNNNGHIKVPTCPMCKAEGQFVRNRPLEKQLHEISVPCKNHEHGCDVRFFAWDEKSQRIHSKTCTFGPVTCPFCLQSISEGRVNFVEHLRLASLPYGSDLNKRGNSENEAKNDLTESSNEHSNGIHVGIRNFNRSNSSFVFAQHLNNNDSSPSFQHLRSFHHSLQSNFTQNDTDFSVRNINDEQKAGMDNNCINQNDIDIIDQSLNGNITSNSRIKGCSMPFMEANLTMDAQKYATFTLTRENTFVVNYVFGYVLVFLKPNEQCPCWKVYCISIAPHHGVAGNNRVYLQYMPNDEHLKYLETEQQQGLSSNSLLRPACNTLQVSMGRLAPEFFYNEKNLIQMEENHNHSIFSQFMNNCTKHNNNFLLSANVGSADRKCAETDDSSSVFNHSIECDSNIHIPQSRQDNYSDDNNIQSDSVVSQDNNNDSDDLDLYDINPSPFIAKSPCTSLQVGYIYAGPENMQHSFKSMHIRLFTLEESIKIGAIIDARDFTGKWYQAEVVKVADNYMHESSLLQDHDPLITRRFKIHYLGYSANYDEWLNIDTDSHRIAQRGIYTVGPDLRTARRYAGRQTQISTNQPVFPRILVENVDVENNNFFHNNHEEINSQ